MNPAIDRDSASEEPVRVDQGWADGGRPREQQAPLSRELLRLVEHSIWANRQWIEFVYSQPDPETRPHELLCHLMVSERVWFERIAGEQKTQTMFPVLAKEELVRGLEENRQTFQRLIATRLQDVIHFRRGTGVEYHARVVDIIHHLLTRGRTGCRNSRTSDEQ
jgi:hypothetical protein